MASSWSGSRPAGRGRRARRSRPWSSGTARWFCGSAAACSVDPHDTQDAFQATFLVLVEKARALWVRDSLGPWLHQVAFGPRRLAPKSAARRRRHEAVGGQDRGRDSQPELKTSSSDPPRGDRPAPRALSSTLVLCDLEGRTHEQAAPTSGLANRNGQEPAVAW